jgi:hypothetical protein
MDGTRVKRWWFSSLQVHFQRKFGGLLKNTLLFQFFFQRVPGQPPLQERTEEDMDSSDDAANDDAATVASSKEDMSD